MNIQYFKSAWGDIKNSPGWFGKLCLLALLNFIPVFGQIVSLGYLYGWAREIAWGTHEPMPARIFANDDGKLYRRGWFVLVLLFVFSLGPYIIVGIGDALSNLGIGQTFFGREYVANVGWIWAGRIVRLVGWVALVFVGILAWVGCMRIAIYDRLSSGFQFSKIWSMFRHDTGGIIRIFGMELLLSLIIGMILFFVFMVLFLLVVSIGISGLISAGYSLDALQYMTQAQTIRVLAQFFSSAGFVGFLALLAALFMAGVAMAFVNALVIRALGYWTMQFDVPRWGGQDDPLPFELDEGQANRVQQPAPSPAPMPVDPASPYAHAQDTTFQTPDPAAAAPVAPLAAASSVEAQAAGAGQDEGVAAPMPEVEYDKPAVVGAGFLMTSAEIDELESDAQAQAVESAEAEVSAQSGGYEVTYTPGAEGDSENRE